MLSRNASSLFWLGRHVERLDFTARLMDAAFRFEALPSPDKNAGWKSAAQASGTGELFAAKNVPPNRAAVTDFLALDPDNPSSIRSCVTKARNDARVVRAALTREAFESLNEGYIELAGRIREVDRPLDMVSLVERVKQEVRNFEGAVWRTLARSENFWFIRLGNVIERADNTARLMDVKYHTLLPEGEGVGGALDQAQWTAILRSVSAVTAYRHIYRQNLKPWLIAELLILKDDLPRSLSHCMDVADEYLQDLSVAHGRVGPADRRAKRMKNQLRGLTVDDIYKNGMHQFLQQFITDNNQLNRDISEQFSF
ncbi:alpha-E domain-containing protein [Pacificimonas sp. WHA3]|uniref:Alpha-E domain-containing protein n=1 Tax=Pacificimonas pallii TaxID=2827236 RepID=A0ABS6SER6_9SPHN|nr:alpha-E domain-containing protein [Pacificimonas pallii]MBV7256436.1 alpha-E domain-containing protein [Pacificimonas pallii]